MNFDEKNIGLRVMGVSYNWSFLIEISPTLANKVISFSQDNWPQRIEQCNQYVTTKLWETSPPKNGPSLAHKFALMLDICLTDI
jgi:hypothetical protein